MVLIAVRLTLPTKSSHFRLLSPSAGTLLIDPETLLLALSTGSAVLDTGQKHAVSYICLAIHLIGFLFSRLPWLLVDGGDREIKVVIG